MKRWVPLVVFAFILQGLSMPVVADQRLQLDLSRSFVVMGSSTSATVRINQVSEASTYDWRKLKLEILAPRDQQFELDYRAVQSDAVSCSGTLTGSGNLAICTGSTTLSRTVIASGTVQSSIASSNVSLLGRSSQEFQIFVTAWVDENGDGLISSYEPKSQIGLVTFLEIESVSSTFNFEVDPPSRDLRGIRGWVYDSSGREAWGKGMTSILDLQRLKVLSKTCVSAASTCTYSSHSPTLVAHPQLSAYRFELSEQWLGDYSTHLSLAYFESEESFHVVAEEEFVYFGPSVARAITGIQATQSALANNLGPKAPASVRSHSLSDRETTFSYTASFFDSNSNPLAYEMVHIKVDSTFLENPSKLRVDGRQITPNSSERDIVWLERVTDGQGRVRIDVENSSPKLWERLEITSQLRGFESHLAGRGGFVETLTWVPSKRTFSMEVTPSGNDLLVQLVLSGPTEFGENFPIAMLSSGKNILFQDSVLKLSGITTGYGPYLAYSGATYLRMRIGSNGSGSEQIGVSVRFAGETYTASSLVQFDGKNGKLKVITTDSSNLQSPEISLTGHRSFWTANIKNAKSKNVTIKAGGRWFKVVPSSDDFVLTRKSKSGSQLPVSVYVDGVLVVSQTIQVR